MQIGERIGECEACGHDKTPTATIVFGIPDKDGEFIEVMFEFCQLCYSKIYDRIMPILKEFGGPDPTIEDAINKLDEDLKGGKDE